MALGLVNSDSFAGLRALLMPAERRRKARRGRALFGMEDSGRWALARRARPALGDARAPDGGDAVEHLVLLGIGGDLLIESGSGARPAAAKEFDAMVEGSEA